MEVFLSTARAIALSPCDCRVKRGNCDGPVEACLSVNPWVAEEMLAHAGWRIVTIEEALDVLRRSHEAGLVHLAYRQRDQEISQICSCCSCCCWSLNALKRFDYHDAIAESAYVATYDPRLCSGCGVRCLRAWGLPTHPCSTEWPAPAATTSDTPFLPRISGHGWHRLMVQLLPVSGW